MLKFSARLLAVAVLCVLVVACGQIESQKQTVQMQDRTRAYRKALRWSEYQSAVSFIRRRDGSTFSYDEDFYDRIRVVDLEIQNREVFLDEGIVIVTSKIEFYHEDYNSVRTLTDRQTWWFDQETEQWYLDGGFPDYASELGI